MPQIILASASIGRRGLLEKLGVSFKTYVSDIDEEAINDPDPYTRIALRARAKAESVEKQISSQYANRSSQKKTTANYELPTTNFLIIAADSEALLDGKTYGKSRNKDHAREIVSRLMGNTHEFLTATCLILLSDVSNPGNLQETQRWEDLTKSYVSMRKMTQEELEDYVTRYDFSRFAAGYTLNETPWDLITKIEGSYTSVIGLPFEVLLPILRNLKLL